MRSKIVFGGAVLTVLFLASAATAAETIAKGKVKSVDATKKEFVFTDTAVGKDFTIKLSDKTVLNRGGKESKSELVPGDFVYLDYEKGVLTWMAKYILVREGDSKDWELTRGKVKGYEGEKQYLTVTDDAGADLTYRASDAKAWINNKEHKFEDLKIGEPVLMVLAREKTGVAHLKWVMIERK